MQIKDALTVCFHYSWRKLSFNFRECLDFCLFRDIVLLRTVRVATSTYGDTYYDKVPRSRGTTSNINSHLDAESKLESADIIGAALSS